MFRVACAAEDIVWRRASSFFLFDCFFSDIETDFKFLFIRIAAFAIVTATFWSKCCKDRGVVSVCASSEQPSSTKVSV
jgi:hypothetical protein